ncbi:MAG: hypothetical protein HY763_10990 [Planctomycetes bacterium]|nr:hypothetical protein [Planctomycetota bacterium]
MADWTSQLGEHLWQNALAIIPLAVLVAVVTRLTAFRPATRHTLWLTVLLWLLAGPLLPHPPALLNAPEPPADAVVVDGQAGISRELPTAARQLPDTPAPVENEDASGGVEPAGRNLPQRLDLTALKTATPGTLSLQRDACDAGSSPLESAAQPALGAQESLAQASGAGGPLDLSLSGAASVRIRQSVEVAPAPGVSSVRLWPVPKPDGNAIVLDGGAAPLLGVRAPEALLAVVDSPAAGPSAVGRLCDHCADTPEPAGVERDLPVVDAVRATEEGGVRLAAIPIGAEKAAQVDAVDVESEAASSATPLGAAEHARGAVDRLRPWLVAMLGVRDAVGALPPMPWSVWLLGLPMLATVKVHQVRRMRRHLRRATAAPPGVLRLVALTARRMGLRRVPETWFVDARLSPMIWCGARSCLVLPRGLWSQLDDIGRQAVICHELAHLKRRDHWVMWLEQVVGSVYWWHPVVWWVRRRLHLEAEDCCDAWVTWLLPRGRRAYAQALLQTHQFVSNREPLPDGGIGIVNGRARRIARRLTMVMTQSRTPSLSYSGMALALVLAIAGWAASPARSCPPAAEGEAHKPCSAGAKASTGAEGTGPAMAPGVHAHSPHAAATPAEDPVAGTTFERHLRDRHEGEAPPAYVLVGAPGRSADGNLEERLARLEAELERLSAHLERLGSALDGHGGTPAPRARRPAPPAAPAPPAQPAPPAPPAPPSPAGSAPFVAMAPDMPLPSDSDGPGAAEMRRGDDRLVIRAYKVPQGKLQALTNLMVRDDVPVRVRPTGDGLEVHATERQHAVFKGFLELISDAKQARSYKIAGGKREALTELMVRSDVPVLVEARNDGLKVHGTNLEQSVFKAFLDMIDPRFEGHQGNQPGDDQGSAAPRREELRQREREERQAAREARERVKRQMDGVRQKAKVKAAGKGSERAEADAEAAEEAEAADAARQAIEALKHSHANAEATDLAKLAAVGDFMESLLDSTANLARAADAEAAGDSEEEQAESHGVRRGAGVEATDLEKLAAVGEFMGSLLDSSARVAMAAGAAGSEGSLEQQAGQFESQSRLLAEHAAGLQRQADDLQARSEELEQRVIQLNEAAEALRSGPLASGTAEARAEAERKVESLESKASTLEEQMHALQTEWEAVEAQAQVIEEQAEAFEEAAEAVRDAARIIAERAAAPEKDS